MREFFDERDGGERLRLSPARSAHVFRVAGLPFRRRDPFDRLLIAQALEESMMLVTREEGRLAPYGVALFW